VADCDTGLATGGCGAAFFFLLRPKVDVMVVVAAVVVAVVASADRFLGDFFSGLFDASVSGGFGVSTSMSFTSSTWDRFDASVSVVIYGQNLFHFFSSEICIFMALLCAEIE
jgi:hypothetical protein